MDSAFFNLYLYFLKKSDIMQSRFVLKSRVVYFSFQGAEEVEPLRIVFGGAQFVGLCLWLIIANIAIPVAVIFEKASFRYSRWFADKPPLHKVAALLQRFCLFQTESPEVKKAHPATYVIFTTKSMKNNTYSQFMKMSHTAKKWGTFFYLFSLTRFSGLNFYPTIQQNYLQHQQAFLKGKNTKLDCVYLVEGEIQAHCWTFYYFLSICTLQQVRRHYF